MRESVWERHYSVLSNGLSVFVVWARRTLKIFFRVDRFSQLRISLWILSTIFANIAILSSVIVVNAIDGQCYKTINVIITFSFVLDYLVYNHNLPKIIILSGFYCTRKFLKNCFYAIDFNTRFCYGYKYSSDVIFLPSLNNKYLKFHDFKSLLLCLVTNFNIEQ